jgi:hypothetical protein
VDFAFRVTTVSLHVTFSSNSPAANSAVAGASGKNTSVVAGVNEIELATVVGLVIAFVFGVGI